MTIAIDYDGTFAADPVLFAKFVHLAKSAGHKCLILTSRSGEGEYGAEVRRTVADAFCDPRLQRGLDSYDPIPIVFAGVAWKRDAAKAAGFDVDVFIDDNPEYIAPQNILLSQHKTGLDDQDATTKGKAE